MAIVQQHYEESESFLSIRVLHMAQLTIGRDWDAADVCSSYWRFYVNQGDGARIRLGDRGYELPAGHVHFIPAWVTFSCQNSEELEHFYVHFDVVGLSTKAVRDTFPLPVSLPLDETSRQIHHQLTVGASALERSMLGSSLVYHSFARMVASLPDDRRRLLELQLVDHFGGLVSFIENRLAEKLRNRDLATFCHLSEDHFIKRFKALMGVSPMQYVTERRLARSAERLIYSTDSIEEIAEATGFPNRHYFTRVFSKTMGVPPGQYRKSSHP